jgi:hypothetical protein
MARAMKRVARKYGDFDLAKAAKELHSRVAEATKNQQLVLSDSDNGRSVSCMGQAEEGPQGDLFSDRRQSSFDPMPMRHAANPRAVRYAEEHRRFLQENRRKLRQSGNLITYLSSVGKQAAVMYSDIMAK